MTKFNWDRVSKENLDYRHRAKIYVDGLEYEYVPRRSSISAKPTAPKGDFTCPQCHVKLNPHNLNKHIKKVHHSSTNLVSKQIKPGSQDIPLTNRPMDLPKRINKRPFKFTVEVDLEVDDHMPTDRAVELCHQILISLGEPKWMELIRQTVRQTGDNYESQFKQRPLAAGGGVCLKVGFGLASEHAQQEGRQDSDPSVIPESPKQI